MNHKKVIATMLVMGGLAGSGFAASPVAAQGPTIAPAVRVGGGLNMCSTTDYTDVAAKALGMTAAELRVALVSGKSLSDLATSKNVKIETVTDALNKARQADLDQAVKDGLLPEGITIKIGDNKDNNGDKTGPATAPGMSIAIELGGRFSAAMGVSARNETHPYVVAAQAIGVTCPDLIKALRTGDTIVGVATKKNVTVQTVVDALVKAEKDALAADVKEGLITQAQADGRSTNLVERMTAFISQHGGFGGMRGIGLPFPGRDGMPDLPGMPGRPGRQGRGNNPNQPGQGTQPAQPGQGTQPGQPPATQPATPPAAS